MTTNQDVLDMNEELLKRNEFYMVDMRAMLYEKAKFNDCFSSERRKDVKEALNHLFAIDVKNFNETDFYSLGIETARFFLPEHFRLNVLLNQRLSEKEKNEVYEMGGFLTLLSAALVPQRDEQSEENLKEFHKGTFDIVVELEA